MNNQGDCVSSPTFVSKPAGTVANGSESDSSYLWPAYFVERPDGTFTALIEVDQLPDFIRIRGLASKLSAVDTVGMTSVGVKKGNQKKYSIDIADISGKSCCTELSKHTTHENASVAPTSAPSRKAPSDAVISLHVQGSPTIAEASFSTRLGPEQEAMTVKPIPTKEGKVYCTYWIARGECHYTQQGCRFKHEMPNLETLREMMGRNSYPKWWLESIRPQRKTALPASHRPSATNRQQGKRQASSMAPKFHGSTPNTHTNSNSATENQNVFAQVPVEGLSSVVSNYIPRKGEELDIPSCIAGQSGNKMRPTVLGPGGGNIRSSVLGRSGKKNRYSISAPSGSIFRSEISGSSGGELCSPVSGPSNNKIRSSASSESVVIHDKQLDSNIRAPHPGPGGNSIIHSKEHVSNDRPSTPEPTNDHSPTYCPAITSMAHSTQLVYNDRSPVLGTRGNIDAENTQQHISNDDNLTTYNHCPLPLPTSPLLIESPQKYIPRFHVGAYTKVSSTSSSAPILQPHIDVPLCQSINGGKSNTKSHEAEMERGHNNEGGISYSRKRGSISEATMPYDEVFDLLGPF